MYESTYPPRADFAFERLPKYTEYTNRLYSNKTHVTYLVGSKFFEALFR